MPAVTASITVRLPERLLERVDEAAASGAVSRNAWLVATLYACLESGAVEWALGPLADGAVRGPVAGWYDLPLPAPAEQPEPPSNFDRLQGAREFRPYPKGGKR